MVLTGGSDTLHHLTVAFVNLICEHKATLPEHRLHSQEVAENVELEIFLVPFAPSPLADYLATEDSWYRRHVYTPFKSLSLLTPSVSTKTNLKMHSARSNHALGFFYQNLISSYTREARSTFRVNIWACHGFKAHSRRSFSSTNTPDKIIPYTTRVDFGELVNTGDLTGDCKPNNVVLKWTRVNRSGDKIGVFTEPLAQYESITCAHTPNQADIKCDLTRRTAERNSVSPARPYFELHCILSSEQKKKRLKTSSYFARYSSALVTNLEITAGPGEQFHVKLDKQMYGPFRKVKLIPLQLDKSLGGTNKSHQVYMKLRTFYKIFDPLYNN